MALRLLRMNLLLVFFLLFHTTHAWKGLCFGDPKVNLPVRYFFVRLQDDEGRNATESGGQLNLEVLHKEECLYHIRSVDRGDGMYIIRLNIHLSCQSTVHVRVSLNGHQLCGNGGYEISNSDGSPLLQEECLCEDLPTSENWIEHAQCAEEPQLQSDLERWKVINFSSVLALAEERYGQPHHSRSYSLCHYVIQDNQIFRKCYGEYVGFHSFADDILLSVTRKMRIPDTEFLMNLGDYPLAHPTRGTDIPIISWCGSKSSVDVVLPTYDLSNSVVHSGRDKEVHLVLGDHPTAWKDKKQQAVFRGRDSNQLRLDLSRLSDKHPDLLDAGITRYFFFDKKKNPPTKSGIPFADFFKYRYIISVDGTVAAYRFPFLLAGDSIILKSESEYYEHFYSKMHEYEHYIPFDKDNAEEAIQWTQNEDLNRTLSSMKQFVLDHLQPRNLYCYYARFFEAYSSKLLSPPTRIPPGMAAVGQSGRRDCNCGERTKRRKKSGKGEKNTKAEL